MRLHPFEYHLQRSIGSSMRGERVLIACSGGRDSCALATVLTRVAPRVGFEILGLAYVHHGPSARADVVEYRSRAQSAVASLGSALGLNVLTLGPAPSELKSEASLRDFRRHVLAAAARDTGATAIALAHHADDLLETRLMRLMRGTGARGLEAMRTRRELAWRPFLAETRATIASYATETAIQWIEDPTNLETESWRNWVRQELLPLLDQKRAGSVRAMARSLELLSSQVVDREGLGLPKEQAADRFVEREIFKSLPLSSRRSHIASWVADIGQRELSSNQVDEILKRLSRFELQGRKAGSFVVSGLTWSVDKNRIRASLSEV